jgi:hypothetical protein
MQNKNLSRISKRANASQPSWLLFIRVFYQGKLQIIYELFCFFLFYLFTFEYVKIIKEDMTEIISIDSNDQLYFDQISNLDNLPTRTYSTGYIFYVKKNQSDPKEIMNNMVSYSIQYLKKIEIISLIIILTKEFDYKVGREFLFIRSINRFNC